jgi:two-component system chemotaxis response regulator CheY
MRILIVDDSKAMRMLIMRTLRQAGFEGHTTSEASSGEEALAFVKATPPELLFLDWNMPDMTGMDVVQELKKTGVDIAFGFVTSEKTPEMQQAARDAGAKFFIAKPFNAESFQQELGSVLA